VAEQKKASLGTRGRDGDGGKAGFSQMKFPYEEKEIVLENLKAILKGSEISNMKTQKK